MRFVVLAFLCAATVIAYLQRLSLTAPTKIIEAELEISPENMGTVMAVWYWCYALFQLPAGWVADRIGSRRAIMLFAGAWSLLTAATGLVSNYPQLMIVWGLMGCAQAGVFPCATKAVGATFPREGQAFASGGLSACMALGSAFSHLLSGKLLGYFTWQHILFIYAAPGGLWVVAFATFAPRWFEAPAKGVESGHANGSAPDWTRLFTDFQMWFLCGQQFFRASAVALFYTWMPRYLVEVHQLTKERAGELAFWPPMAGAVGGILGGIVSDFLLRATGNARLSRQGMAAALTVMCAALGLSAYYASDTNTVIFLLCGVAFGAMASGVSGYSVAIGYGGTRVATVFATMNMCGNIGAGLFPIVVGWLVTRTGDWNLSLLVFACLFAGSALCWLVLNPRGTLFPEQGPVSLREDEDDDAN